jgi:AcrR family transcriptional regulator
MIQLSRKEHIRNSAQKLFRIKGYAATSMRDLAKDVGVEAPSIYNHYTSKNELLKDICFDIAAQFYQAFTTATTNKKTVTQKLSAAIQSHIQVIYNNIEASSVFFDEWMFLEGADLVKFKKLRSDYQQQFHKLIEKGIEANEIKNVDIHIAVFTILSSLNAVHELRNKADVDEIAATVSNLLLNGISNKS